MRTFFLLRHLNPDNRQSRGFVLREGSGKTSYRVVKADHATLYTTRSGAANSMPHALKGLGITVPSELGRYSTRGFVKKHFEIVEIKAILMPTDGFLNSVLG